MASKTFQSRGFLKTYLNKNPASPYLTSTTSDSSLLRQSKSATFHLKPDNSNFHLTIKTLKFRNNRDATKKKEMKFLSALLVLAKAQEITTTATTTTEQWDHVASSEDMSKLNGSYRTSDKYGRRLEIEYLHGSVFQVKWKTYSGIVIKGTKHNFDVDWPHFSYKGYMVSF